MPYTLLLADDSVTIQRVIELTFADEDVTVVAVGDGDQAIERLDKAPPDIVLADVGMPGRNGYEVAQYVRRSPTLSHIPVVLLTGAFEPIDQARADDAGCNGVLAKPFEPQLVISRVKELLARPNTGATAGASPRSAGDADAAGSTTTAMAEPADYSWAPPAPQEGAISSSLAEPDPARGGAVPDLTDYFDQLDAAFSAVKPEAAPSAALAAGGAADAPMAPVSSPAEPPSTQIDWSTYASPPPDVPPALNSFAAVDAAAPEQQPAAILSAVPAVQDSSSPGADERLAPIEEGVPVEPEAWPAAAAAWQPADATISVPTALETLTPTDTHTAPTAAIELPLRHAPPLPHLADAFAALLAVEQNEPVPTGALWPASPAPTPSPVVTEEMIEAVTRRVLGQLSDSVVRQAVADIASSIAERVIREEIERIKAALE